MNTHAKNQTQKTGKGGGTKPPGKKPEELRALLRGKRSLLIVMQDNPDPDSIAAAAALRRLANALEGVSCSIAYGGVIGRAENQSLAGYLALRFRRWEQVDPSRFELIALVDTQPNTGNNSLPTVLPPHIVLDHHPLRQETAAVPYADVRPRYGAVSTMLFEYLSEFGIKPEPPLATALLYAIRTDTQDLGHEACRADIEAAEALFPLANARMLSVIQRGQVTPSYFRAVATALDTARVYGERVVACVGETDTPDLTGEVADMLSRLQGAAWVLCYGFHDGQIWASLRKTPNEVAAGKLMQRIVAKIGTGGGHSTSAGGQIRWDDSQRGKSRRGLVRRVRERFLAHTGGRARGRRLVPPRHHRSESAEH